jgi:hypothetical protein
MCFIFLLEILIITRQNKFFLSVKVTSYFYELFVYIDRFLYRYRRIEMHVPLCSTAPLKKTNKYK